MRLILVRHGDPDYANDCLTPLGHQQAAATADHLAQEGIARIFSSSKGRALQTASYTAQLLGLPVEPLDFMREISWGSSSDDPAIREGHPWTLGDRLIAEEDFDFAAAPWRTHPFFSGNQSNDFLDMIARESDAWLASLGYVREGTRYRCAAQQDETIALFFHGGSGACLLSRMLNLPFPYVCAVLPYGLTSVTVLELAFAPGECVFPKVGVFGDMGHLRGLVSKPAPCGN